MSPSAGNKSVQEERDCTVGEGSEFSPLLGAHSVFEIYYRKWSRESPQRSRRGKKLRSYGTLGHLFMIKRQRKKQRNNVQRNNVAFYSVSHHQASKLAQFSFPISYSINIGRFFDEPTRTRTRDTTQIPYAGILSRTSIAVNLQRKR
jgi:hypothetical protein